jgi:Pyruvate/2-oxoacid:ferredoxin oxidoreductase delta subunit
MNVPETSRKFVISAKCTLCGNCVQVCPTRSIFLTSLQYVIDTDTCDGHAICAQVCPVNAISELSGPISTEPPHRA